MNRFNRYNTRGAKHSPETIQEIRRLYHEERYSQGRLARQFSYSIGQIGRIVRNESWQGLPPEDRGDAVRIARADEIDPVLLQRLADAKPVPLTPSVPAVDEVSAVDKFLEKRAAETAQEAKDERSLGQIQRDDGERDAEGPERPSDPTQDSHSEGGIPNRVPGTSSGQGGSPPAGGTPSEGESDSD